ncbi:hypothetical protein E4U32_007970 [Claviceps aff. humidiphila group G2b]|nr:hypothetical protein E4U32_007970 [Claviceps aff. humidiphila group G2b]
MSRVSSPAPTSREPGEPDSAAVNNQPESASPFQVQQVQAVPDPLVSLVSGGSVSVLFPNVDLQTRLNRLPDWTFGWHEQLGGASSSSSRERIIIEDAGYQRGEQPFATQSSVRLAPYPRSPTSTLNQMKADGMWVEEKLICNKLQMRLTSKPPTESFFDASISFHLTPIRLIKKPYCVVQDTSASNSGIGARQMCIFIPLYPEACTIVNTFTSDWLAVSPTVHMSSLLLCIQTIYTCIQE